MFESICVTCVAGHLTDCIFWLGAADDSHMTLSLTTAMLVGTTPLGWVHHSSYVPSTTPISFSFCLKSETPMEALFTSALEVSTPGHERYGKFLTIGEIEQITAPSSADVAAVSTWFQENNIEFTRHKECLRAETTVGLASRLLNTPFHMFRREVDGRLKLRAGEYMLPPRVEQAVEAVFGLHGVPLPPLTALPSTNDNPPFVTPTVLAQTYHVKDPYVKRGGKNKQAVAEFQGQYMSKDDLTTFFKEEVHSLLTSLGALPAHFPWCRVTHPPCPHPTHPDFPRGALHALQVPTMQEGDDQVSAFKGVPYKKGTGTEALLDIEFIMGGVLPAAPHEPPHALPISRRMPSPSNRLGFHVAVAPGVATEFWEWPDADFCADLFNYTTTLLTPGGPVVNSISYGWQGDLKQVGCEDDVVAKVDANWAKLAAAGISMFISSGDSGSQCTSSKCAESGFKKDKKVSGGKISAQRNSRLDQCCRESGDAVAFTWSPPKDVDSRRGLMAHHELLPVEERASAPPPPPAEPITFKKSPYASHPMLLSMSSPP